MMVFYDDYHHVDEPSAQTPRWFRLGDNSELLAGQSLRFKMCYYFAAVIGMPQNLLGLVRDNLSGDLISGKKNYIETVYQALNPALTLGAVSSKRGFGPGPIPNEENAPFVDFNPPTGTLAQEVSVYSPTTRAKFQFTGPPTPPFLLYFAQKFAAQSQEQGIKLVLLHIPVIDEVRDPVIHEREFWPDALHTDLTMVGIPSGELFATMSDDDIHKLFYNPDHFNKNGQEYFTAIITPALLQIYRSQFAH